MLILILVDITHQDDSSAKRAADFKDTDGFTATGKITQLKERWDTLCMLGLKVCCFPEGSKTWLIIKENQEHGIKTFKRTKTKITTDGQLHLGVVIGFIKYTVKKKSVSVDQGIVNLVWLCRPLVFTNTVEPV